MLNTLQTAASSRASDVAQQAGAQMGRLWPALVLVTAALAGCYRDVIVTLVRQWGASDTYSFGVLVPFISGYLVWLRRARLQAVPIVPSYIPGAVSLCAAAGLLLIGRLSAIIAFQQLSLILMTASLVLFLLGPHVLRVLWFPIAYLLLMLPVWDVVTDRIHFPFQMFSAWLGVSILHAIGIPVYRDHTALYLPNITLEVARACSGVNYLIAVFALGVPQAYLFVRGWAPRVAVVLFAGLVAFISNGVRIALIGVFAYRELSEYVHGPGHVFQGLFVSVVGFLAVFIGVGVLARRYPARPDLVGSRAPVTGATGVSHRALWGLSFASAVFLFALGAFHPQPPLTAAEASEKVASGVGTEWRLTEDLAQRPFVKGETGFNSIGRVYQNARGERIELFASTLAYVDRATGLSYREVELPRDAVPVRLQGRGGTEIAVNRASFIQYGRRLDVAYWYDLDGQVRTERSLAKAYTALQLLTSRQPARLFLVVTEAAPSREQGGALIRFVSAMLLGGATEEAFVPR